MTTATKTWWPWLDYSEAWPVCGLEYVRESEEDRRIHRARHREVVRVYEPKPDRLVVLIQAVASW